MSHRHRSARSIRGFWARHRSSRAFRHGTVAAAALVTLGAAIGVLLANNQSDSGHQATPSAIQADGSLYPPTPSVAYSPKPGGTAGPDGSPAVPGSGPANPLNGADAGLVGQPAPTLGTGPGGAPAGTHQSTRGGRSGGGSHQLTAAPGGTTSSVSTPGSPTSLGKPANPTGPRQVTGVTGPRPATGPTTAGHDGANHSPAPQQPTKAPSSSPPKHSGSSGGTPSTGGASSPGSSAPDTPSQTPTSGTPRDPTPSQPAAAPPVDVPPSRPPVDNVAPRTTASTVSAADGVWSIRLGADESAYFECNLDGTGWRSCSANPSYSNMHPGPHTFSARATDLAGNTDPTPAELSIKFTGNGSSR